MKQSPSVAPDTPLHEGAGIGLKVWQLEPNRQAQSRPSLSSDVNLLADFNHNHTCSSSPTRQSHWQKLAARQSAHLHVASPNHGLHTSKPKLRYVCDMQARRLARRACALRAGRGSVRSQAMPEIRVGAPAGRSCARVARTHMHEDLDTASSGTRCLLKP